jgi:hypothetical protein
MRVGHWLTAALAVTAVTIVTAAAVFADEPTNREAVCSEQGGCVRVTGAWLHSQLQRVFNEGFAEGRGSVKCVRPTI